MKSNIETTKAWQERSRQRAREAPQKKRKPLPKRTEKRAAQEREYSERRKIYLEAHPLCERCLADGIQTRATEIHHIRGRDGVRLIDSEEFCAVCMYCHEWIEAHPQEAMALGWSKSRHTRRDSD